MARPTKMTQEIIAKLEQAYAMDCTDVEACLYADISHQTLYDYQKKCPEFVERKQALKNRPFLIARNTLIQGIKSDPDLALKYMERKKKDEFSLRTEQILSGDKENPVLIINAGPNPYSK